MEFHTMEDGTKVRIVETRSQLRTGIILSPVRAFVDPWRGRVRILDYRGTCRTPECTRPLWEFRDGENDPRGFTGDYTAHDITDDGEEAIYLCAIHANEEWSYTEALERIRRIRARKAARNAT